MASGSKKFFIIAGEASGDFLGAQLMRAIKQRDADARFAGLGGAQMQAQGLSSLFPMQEISLMGLLEIIPHIPRVLRRIRETVDAIEAFKPDAVITIDSPGFTKRVVKMLGKGKFPLVHYVAPTVWAWRPGRARKMARLFDHLLVLLPFEPPYFTAHGLDTVFVGHPIVEIDVDKISPADFCAKYNIDTEKPILCLLPGSRMGEVKRLLPVFLDAARQIHAKRDAEITLLTLPHLFDHVSKAVAASGLPVKIITSAEERFALFQSANAALAASGSVSLELARCRLPMVMAYKVNPLTEWLLRLLVKTKYFTLTNILLKRKAIPEFLQQDATADKLAGAVDEILSSQLPRAEQLSAYMQSLTMLKPDAESPSGKAAEAVLKLAA